MNKPADGIMFDSDGNVIADSGLPMAIYSPLEGLFAQYDTIKRQLEYISSQATKESAAFLHFLEGNGRDVGIRSFNVGAIFKLEGAMASLNAEFWSKAMKLTDTLAVFAASKRNEWHEMVRDMKTPAFDRETVISTLTDLMLNRGQFFAEKVDGVYRNLSRNHKTNSAFGFTHRMVMEYCLTVYGKDWYSVNNTKAEFVTDLRAIVATVRGVPDTSRNTYWDISRAVDAKIFGEWMEFDGGAIRLRIYKKGTVHVEIHPDIAWKLNKELAMIHPAAIPSELREPPKKKFKEFELHTETISFELREMLASKAKDSRNNVIYVSPPGAKYSGISQSTHDELISIIEYLGGVKTDLTQYSFDYDIKPVFFELARRGTLPEQVTHQYYPTPETLAQRLYDMLDIEPHHTILEPQGGMGALLVPVDDPTRITCVEISPLHCEVLKSKGYTVVPGDFLTKSLGTFDRILMNPPFSEGRAVAHLEHALKHLNKGGTLGAILPASLSDDNLPCIKGMRREWENVEFAGFADTKVNVKLLKVSYPA